MALSLPSVERASGISMSSRSVKNISPPITLKIITVIATDKMTHNYQIT